MSLSFKLPAIFVGHGSPMNAIEINEFTHEFSMISNTFPKPETILCISAHWETFGTQINSMQNPKTIHDFRGFPEELYSIEYPAQGNPDLAKRVALSGTKEHITLSEKWGIDHGAWSVLRHMYPMADIPVVKMSLNVNMTPQEHYQLGKELVKLRSEGVLILGSGNIIHNLRLVAWDMLGETGFAYDWAEEAREIINSRIMNDDHRSLIDYRHLGRSVETSIPTPEHYLPLLYILAQKDEKERVTLFNDKHVGGSLSMTSLIIR